MLCVLAGKQTPKYTIDCCYKVRELCHIASVPIRVHDERIYMKCIAEHDYILI